jgi:hypothetical protein
MKRLATTAIVSALCVGFGAGPATAADRRAEAAANEALKKAANDYLATDYGAAVQRLERALKACGARKCTSRTRATLLRDLGTMQFRSGDVGTAKQTWSEALKLVPDLALSRDYDTPDLHSAWEEAKGSAASTEKAEKPDTAATPPAGDFAYIAPTEQRVSTPLAIYAEYAGEDNLARVIVKYKGPSAKEWSRLELKRMGSGWGGLIPCGDVTLGTLRYWLQGFDDGGEPVANSGDMRHPYSVTVKAQVASEPSHLPGKSPPKACSEDTDCPPGLAGCAPEGEKGGDQEANEGDKHAAEGAYARLWFGVAAELPEFLQIPAGQDLCKLTNAGLPSNSVGAYCTNPDGSDFPTRASRAQNDQLVQGQAGRSDGGLHTGDVRIMALFDYALSANLLVGARLGYVLSAYTGQAAVSAGHALGPKIHAEVRATYLFGSAPLAQVGFAPMVFVGTGISEFDGSVKGVVSQTNVAGQEPVNIWITDAPFFVALGGGIRYQFSVRAAFTLAARANAVIGASGLLMTYGPEVGIQYGF